MSDRIELLKVLTPALCIVISLAGLNLCQQSLAAVAGEKPSAVKPLADSNLKSQSATHNPTEAEWFDIPQQQLVYLQLADGVVVLQLAEQFAPIHSQRFRQLVHAGFYDGLSFYRVIDQFVLQAGLAEGEKHPSGKVQRWPPLKAEFSWPVRSQDPYLQVEQNDLYAKETGFNQGFAVGREDGQEWLLNCANMIAMARDSAKDSATTDFAIMQGQAPRHLDRNMSVFARVVYGGEWLNLVKRGDRNLDGGVIANKIERTLILTATMGNELDPAKQLPLQISNTHSKEFAAKLAKHRKREGDFFHDKGLGKVDICYQQVPVRLRPKSSSNQSSAQKTE